MSDSSLGENHIRSVNGRQLQTPCLRSYPRAMPDSRFPILDRLIREASRTASRKPDSVDMLASMIHLALEDGADPYLIAGVLLEGAVYAVVQHIPPERQSEAARTMAELLAERLASRGL
jgi:hypothetical protein